MLNFIEEGIKLLLRVRINFDDEEKQFVVETTLCGRLCLSTVSSLEVFSLQFISPSLSFSHTRAHMHTQANVNKASESV